MTTDRPASADSNAQEDTPSDTLRDAVRAHDATLTVAAPDGRRYELPVLWAEDGSVLPLWDEDAAETVACILEEQSSAQPEDPIVGLAVSLQADAQVSAPVELDDSETGFFADPAVVQAWVRRHLN